MRVSIGKLRVFKIILIRRMPVKKPEFYAIVRLQFMRLLIN
jgi:hypothetical protein